MHVALIVAITPQIGWQMISNIYNLSHILHLVSEPLLACTGSRIHQVHAAATGSEASDAIGEILVLGRGAVAFNGVQIELILVGCSADAPLVDLWWDGSALVGSLLVQAADLVAACLHLVAGCSLGVV